MRIAFAWDFKSENGMNGWKVKDDSFQHTIKRFAETNNCAIFAKGVTSEDSVIGKNNLVCHLRPTWQEIVHAISVFKPDIIFSQGFGTTLSNAIPDFFKETKKILAYVGGPLEGKAIPYDVVSVSREYQKEEIFRKVAIAEKELNKKFSLNVSVVPYGVDTEKFNIQNTQRPIDVVVAADYLPVKRLHLLKGAQRKMKNLKFSFVGYETKIPYEYMPNIFNSAKISAIVSTREDGGPRVVPESLACGTPVLTCWDSEGVWSATKKFTEVGEVVRPDVDSIVFGIKDLIERVSDEDQEEKMRKQCREVAVKELSYEQMFEKYKVIVDGLF